MNEMNITSAQYIATQIIDTATDTISLGDNVMISAIIDGVEMSVPLDPANRHYAAILAAVEAGTLTIADADPVEE